MKQIHVADTKRGKTCASESQLVLVLVLIGRESGARFLNQSLSVVIQNQSKRELLSTLKLKTILTNIIFDDRKVRDNSY